VRGTLLAVLALSAFAVASCGYPDPYTSTGPVANESPGNAPSPSPGVDDFNAGAGLPTITYPDGLKYIDLKAGTGAAVRTGDTAVVHYTGWFTSGVKFDSSRDRGTTFPVTIGKTSVVVGWTEGLPGMQVGGKRKLIIPPSLGYGASGQTDPNTGAVIIPGNATLVFEIELVSFTPGPSPSPVPTPKASPSPSPTPSH
jgi:FKBP-type peptidyl-prolyl cis-trans isomerase FkpA